MGRLILPLLVYLLAADHTTGDSGDSVINNRALIDLLTARLEKLEKKVETIHPTDCSCNGLIDTNGKGECLSKWKGVSWCYVDPDSGCNDTKLWTGKSGLHSNYSYEACAHSAITKECPKWRKNIQWMNGRKGFLGTMHIDSAEACQQSCQTKVDYANRPCIGWTYWANSSPWADINLEGGRWCYLFSNDDLGNQTLESTAYSSLGAVSGRPMDCESGKASQIDDSAIIVGLGKDFMEWNKLGPDDKNGSNTWEVLGGSQCSLPPFPLNVTHAIATATDDTILVCGGQDENYKVLQSCHQLKDGAWSPAPPMEEARTNAAAVLLEGPDGLLHWMVTGGRQDGKSFLDSMEIYHIRDADWDTTRMRLPEATRGHCIVQINATTLFVTGGYILHSSGSGATYSYQANMLNLETGEWTRMPDMREDRAWHECFVMGDKVVVAGNLIYRRGRQIDVFDLKTEVWKKEKNLPEDVYLAGSVKDGANVMVLGAGKDANKILKFTWIEGELQVTSLPDTLKNGKKGGVFLKVNKKLLNCQ